jgi:hypothetical protein
MADQKISQLASGAPLQDTDEFVIARSGSNYKIAASSFADATNLVSQSDIGTAPNEVPLNQYLGTMAFQDADAITVGQVVTSGNVGIGAAAADNQKLNISGTMPVLSGNTNSFGSVVAPTIPSSITNAARGYYSSFDTEAASFTVNEVQHFFAIQGSIGAGSTVTNRYGFYVHSSFNNGTNNYGFYSNIASGANRWNLFCNGTAENYVANNLKIGGTADRATTAGTAQLVLFDGTAPVGTLANGVSFYSSSGEANVMDAAGNATLLSPHDSETNEWIFRSKHTPTGKVLKIDVEKMLRFINEHFDLDMIHEFTE